MQQEMSIHTPPMCKSSRCRKEGNSTANNNVKSAPAFQESQITNHELRPF